MLLLQFAGLGRVERGEDGLDGDAPAGDELAAGAGAARRRPAPPSGSPTRARRPRCRARAPRRPPRGRRRRAGRWRRPRTRRSRRSPLATARRGRCAATEPSSSLTMNAMSRIRMIPRSTRSTSSGATSPVRLPAGPLEHDVVDRPHLVELLSAAHVCSSFIGGLAPQSSGDRPADASRCAGVCVGVRTLRLTRSG